MRWRTSWLVVVAAGCAFTPPEGVLHCDPETPCPPSFVCRADLFCWRAELDAGADLGALDAGSDDSGAGDSAVIDSGAIDSAVIDSAVIDSGAVDSAVIDSGAVDSAVIDSAPTDLDAADASSDASLRDVPRARGAAFPPPVPAVRCA